MTITDTAPKSVDNGVNVEHLFGAKQHMSDMPELAQFQFRAEAQWAGGVHTRTTLEKFDGAGGEQSHHQEFVLDTDHPELFAATDRGITGPEMMLVALAGCLTGTMASVAQNRGIQLHAVKATVEGDIDLSGILGIDPEVRNGYRAIRVSYDIDAEATPAEVEALVAQAQKRSSVYDNLTNPTSVVVSVR